MSEAAKKKPYMLFLDALQPWLDSGETINYAALAEKFGVSRNTVSYRVCMLRNAGFIHEVGGRPGRYVRGDGTPRAYKSRSVKGPETTRLCYVSCCYEPRAPGEKMCERHRYKPRPESHHGLMAGRV